LENLQFKQIGRYLQFTTHLYAMVSPKKNQKYLYTLELSQNTWCTLGKLQLVCFHICHNFIEFFPTRFMPPYLHLLSVPLSSIFRTFNRNVSRSIRVKLSTVFLWKTPFMTPSFCFTVSLASTQTIKSSLGSKFDKYRKTRKNSLDKKKSKWLL
jgi:hypothetical protein